MVKWDASTDQILLLKILETSQVNADVRAIAEAWPPNLDKPTPRAITERLVKIRKDVKSSGVNTHFSVSRACKDSSATGNAGSDSSPAATPQKRAPRGSVKAAMAAAAAGQKSPATNGKRSTNEYNEDDESNYSPTPQPPLSATRAKRAKRDAPAHKYVIDVDSDEEDVVKVEILNDDDDDDYEPYASGGVGGDGAGESNDGADGAIFA